MSISRLVVVHNNIDRQSSIGKLALWAVHTALSGGYEVVTVARDLDPSLRGQVQHLELHVPAAVFAYQWSRALGTVQVALKDVRFDLLHTFQAQLTGIADTWHNQYLTRAAQETGIVPQGRGVIPRWRRTQTRAVSWMEDRYLMRLPQTVSVLFPSSLMLDQFSRLYGRPTRYRILPNPAPETEALTSEFRARSRHEYVGDLKGLVVGYLGGLDERKGWRVLLNGAARDPRVILLFGGSGSEGLSDSRLDWRLRPIGYVKDIRSFMAACDLLAVPSAFDPFAMVVTEAAAYGVPSIVTPMVGAIDQVVNHEAGVAWDGRPETFSQAVEAVRADLTRLRAGAFRMAAQLAESELSKQLLDAWSEAFEYRQGGPGRPAT